MNTGHPTIIYDPTERARLESRRDRQRDMAEPVKLMWEPPSGRETQMDKLRKTINLKYGLDLVSYDDLYKWSVVFYDKFWAEVWEYCDIIHSKTYDEVVDMTKEIGDNPEWFRGSRLNFAENLLRYDGAKVALIQCGEGQKPSFTTYSQLRGRVASIASALRACGVTKGDRVVGYLPNCTLAVEAMLATSSIGAVWSSTSPDFGVTGVLGRFSQIAPKVLFSVEAVRYNGKEHWHLDKVKSVVQGLPGLQKVVIMPFVGTREVDLAELPNSVLLPDFLQDHHEAELQFAPLPFNHPLFIMYSSGTTGPPKCMVHSQGGTLIQIVKEHVFHGDMTPNDVMLFYTTTGWMMWNWLVTGLASGIATVLYDGSPFIPSHNVLWDLVDDLGVTTLGSGAKYFAALEEKGARPMETHNLDTLRSILSTGSPLKPQSYDYIYTSIKRDLLLGSITGGTDIISCFAGNNPTLPVYRGEIQYRNLGMAVEAWDFDGKPVFDERGELVCVKPFPSMPVYFWKDEGGAKYKKAYFSTFPGVWCHGDFIIINSATGGIEMLGRSDGTLNPAGIRFGSAEIYNIVEQFDEIEDSLCVGQTLGADERVVLFLKLSPGHQFDKSLKERVRSAIRRQLSPRHVPSVMLETQDIPYTHNGKKVEVAVKRVICGQEVPERGAYRNPESIDLFASIPELQCE